MQKIAFIIYRNWAYQIFEEIYKFKEIRDSFQVPILITTKECEFKHKLKSAKTYIVDGSDNSAIEKILIEYKIDVCLFYGWSWMVGKNVLEKFLCLCLHPSPLPKYRGGTPIQHQLINNEKQSAVTIFKMTEGIDDGDIYKQENISLSGNIEDIFKRIIDLGSQITKQLIVDLENNELRFKEQKNLQKNPPLKRRTPAMSEIKYEELKSISFKKLNNLVRGLRDPFPNVFINLENLRLKILFIRKYKGISENALVLRTNLNKKDFTKHVIFLKLKDSFAKLEEFKIEKI